LRIRLPINLHGILVLGLLGIIGRLLWALATLLGMLAPPAATLLISLSVLVILVLVLLLTPLLLTPWLLLSDDALNLQQRHIIMWRTSVNTAPAKV
jgi:hypothetical protein